MKEKPTHLVVELASLPTNTRKRLIKEFGAVGLVAEGAHDVKDFTWTKPFKKWSDSLTHSVSSKTAREYRGYVRKFIGNTSKKVVMPSDKKFSEFINATDLTFGARKARWRGVHSFFKWLHNENIFDRVPTKNIKAQWRDLPPTKVFANPDPPFTQEEVDRILADKEKFFNFWRWAVHLGYYMGLAMADVATLRMSAWGENELRIVRRKTGKTIVLPYDHPALGAGIMRKIKAEIFAYYRGESGDLDKPCWIRQSSAYEKNPQALQVKFKDLISWSNIWDKGFHSLRRGCATRCHSLGMRLEDIGQVLGHSSIHQSATYVHSPINRSELNGHHVTQETT